MPLLTLAVFLAAIHNVVLTARTEELLKVVVFHSRNELQCLADAPEMEE